MLIFFMQTFIFKGRNRGERRDDHCQLRWQLDIGKGHLNS